MHQGRNALIPMAIKLLDITGLILAGGRGSRMGGVDKGVVNHLGAPLALHALRRLAPQVGRIAINANRNMAVYEAMGVPVWADELADYPGPLAGMLAGLAHCETPYMTTVPCDTPHFPLDLVERLIRGLVEVNGDIAMAFTLEEGVQRRQPVFILMNTCVKNSAMAHMRSGQGNVGTWASQQRCARVVFEDRNAFFSANTPADLAQLRSGAN